VNLHAIAVPAIAVVNPQIPVTYLRSTGQVTEEDGSQTPTYAAPITLAAQIQALSFEDLKLLEGLSLQGTRRKIYLFGRVDGINRDQSLGGDLIEYPVGTSYPFGTSWKVVLVSEQWPDWCCVYVTQQIAEPVDVDA
jgi:hypothetical protein